eukprot:9055257-Prorocentrum_lima.AAC.1
MRRSGRKRVPSQKTLEARKEGGTIADKKNRNKSSASTKRIRRCHGKAATEESEHSLKKMRAQRGKKRVLEESADADADKRT